MVIEWLNITTNTATRGCCKILFKELEVGLGGGRVEVMYFMYLSF